MSQSVDVAQWVRPAIEHAQDVLSGGLGQEWEYKFMLSFLEGPVCVQPFMPFLLLVFSFFVLVVSFSSKTKSFVLGLSSDFSVFCSLVFRLESSLQKKNLSSSKLVLIQFGYRGVSFFSHAVSCWFVVLSKLALVSLDYYIITFQPGWSKV